MNRAPLLFPAALLLAPLAAAAVEPGKPLAERVKEFTAKYQTPAAIDARLKEWSQQEPANPDPYIFAANAYLKIASQVNVQAGPAGKGAIADLVDPKTQKRVGSISEQDDPAQVKKAAALLAEASAKFPRRLDIFVGRMAVAERAQDPAGVLAAGLDLVKAAEANPDSMLWLDGAPLPAPLPTKVADELQGRIARLYAKETDDTDRAAYQLATAGLRVAPGDVRLLNDAALYHCYKDEWKQAREFFLRAEKADPSDLLVKHNLGKAEASLGDKAAARAKWEEIIKLAPQSDEAEAAQSEIAKLDPKPPGKAKKNPAK